MKGFGKRDLEKGLIAQIEKFLLELGIILCRSKNSVAAAYSLRGTAKSIGLTDYDLNKALSPLAAKTLPTSKQLEAELLKASSPQMKK